MDARIAREPYPATRVILFAGLVAGTLDIAAACIVSWLRAGVTPVRVLQSVAAGVYGSASFGGGTKTAVVGLIPPLHYRDYCSHHFLRRQPATELPD